MDAVAQIAADDPRMTLHPIGRAAWYVGEPGEDMPKAAAHHGWAAEWTRQNASCYHLYLIEQLTEGTSMRGDGDEWRSVA